MINKLRKLTKKYVKDRRLVDENFVYDLLDIYRSYHNICLSNVIFNNKVDKDIRVPGKYSSNKETMILSLDRLEQKAFNDFPELNDYYSIKKPIEFLILVEMQVILHELEHARQEYLKQHDDNIYSDILRLSDLKRTVRELYFDSIEEKRRIISTFKKDYYDNYEYAPNERSAEVFSNDIIRKMVKNSNKPVKNYFNYKYLENLRRGYELVDDKYVLSPDLIYLNNLKMLFKYRKASWYSKDYNELLYNVIDNYSFDCRVKNGLLITKDEYEFLLNNDEKILKL